MRHGGAKHVDVALARNGSTATIEVRDDGRGLPAIRRPGSNGLRSMRARADTIGATLSLGPGHGGRGTSVVLSLVDRSRPRELEAMIRILIVDDHPAMRAGLTAGLRAEPGFVPLEAATSEKDLWPTLNRTKTRCRRARLPPARR